MIVTRILQLREPAKNLPLIDALAAGHAEGGDKREELPVQSAALLVERTESREIDPYYEDLRVDATETPAAGRRETCEEARRGQEIILERYADDGDDGANAGDGASGDDERADDGGDTVDSEEGSEHTDEG